VVFYRKSDQESSLRRLLQTHSILVDGLLGTGARLPLKPEVADFLSKINEIISNKQYNHLKVVAVDCPSGLDCDTGKAAPEVIPAHLTVTMAAIKQGLLKFPAFSLVGRLKVVEIGLPNSGAGLSSWESVKTFIPDSKFLRKILPPRDLNSHKGTFGTTLISAGCIHYPGAAFLSGKAAYRIGTGLVTMAVPRTVYSDLAGQFPEAIWLPLPEESGFVSADAVDVLNDHLARASAFLVGPGFGLHRNSQEFIIRLFSQPGQIIPEPSPREFLHSRSFPSVIIDADALKLISRLDHWWEILPPNSILTPHPGEMAILSGLAKEEIQLNRLEVAEKFSQLWGHIVVLKGAFTVVASPDTRSAIIPIATPALARAGTGDVLAGMIAGLRAQGIDAFHAAVAGAWIHAQAGIKAAEKLGNSASVLAGDVLDAVPTVLTEISNNTIKVQIPRLIWSISS
jgi:NAD(P)H-hydrate epimerase